MNHSTRYRLIIKEGGDRLFYFQLRSPNGKIVMQSMEGYLQETNALRTARRLAHTVFQDSVELPER